MEISNMEIKRQPQQTLMIDVSEYSQDERNALFEQYNEQLTKSAEIKRYVLFSKEPTGFTSKEFYMAEYECNTRRDYSLVPLIIRFFCRMNLRIALRRTFIRDCDTYPEEFIWLDIQPEEFWKTVALAQMWYEGKK